MKALTRIRLINWHYLTNHTLDVDGSLYLFGKNESGKSSILDAIQFVLVADLRRIHWNASAQNASSREAGQSGRNLQGYVRCKVGEKYLRDEATAFVALQFADSDETPFIVGAVADVHSDDREEHAFFILNNQMLDDRLFLDGEGRPYSRSKFVARTRDLQGAKTFSAADEYQEALRNRLGRLNKRFFDLFVKAFSFKPVDKIREFVEGYLLDKDLVDIEPLRRTQERLDELLSTTQRVEAQINALKMMMQADERRAAAARTLQLHDYLVRCAEREQAQARLSQNRNDQAALSAQIKALDLQLDEVETDFKRIQNSLDQAQATLNQDSLYQLRQNLQKEADRLRRVTADNRTRRETLLYQLRLERRNLDTLLAYLPSVLPNERHDLILPLRNFSDWIAALPEGLDDPDTGLSNVAAARDALKLINDWARRKSGGESKDYPASRQSRPDQS